MPYIVATKSRYNGANDLGYWATVFRRAVATLEERHVFNAREWKSAGHDQPDGNLQFWHPALILARHTHEGHYRDREEQEAADVLWLHDGTVSHGHLTYMMGEPGEPTYRLAPFPARWPERVIPESGGTVTLPDGTVIEVERKGKFYLADVVPHARYLTEAELIDAFNAREQAQDKEMTR